EARWARLQTMADRYGQPLAFALLDLDHFRAFNNRYGHDVGDVVLRQLAASLIERFHGEDVVARWGGDEITLVLYGMTREDGVRRVDDALLELSAMVFQAPCGDRLRISFSAGVSEYRRDGDGLRELYLRADEALLRAKSLGEGSVLPAGWTTWPAEAAWPA
ncbi:MAG: GGDEF domain-containing protein, partial [Acidimicrobiales bacterium]|nr:GGDEF domain-containing protein [Acidimicrobiales bacterium]